MLGAYDIITPFAYRGDNNAQPGEPELVHRLDVRAGFDYLVPFGRGADVTAILRVDARFGYLQQAVSYSNGIRFPQLTRNELLRRLADVSELEVVQWISEETYVGLRFPEKYPHFGGIACVYPTMVWLPCWESRSPYYPFYMVSIGGQRFFVSTFDGTVYRGLHRFGPTGPRRPGGL